LIRPSGKMDAPAPFVVLRVAHDPAIPTDPPGSQPPFSPTHSFCGAFSKPPPNILSHLVIDPSRQKRQKLSPNNNVRRLATILCKATATSSVASSRKF
jgi:hypothetical protein